jgi:hypothetical protein
MLFTFSCAQEANGEIANVMKSITKWQIARDKDLTYPRRSREMKKLTR